MEMLLFNRAVRTGDWRLHLTSLQMFTKYFFFHDRTNYARMIPLYLAEMQMLPESDPDIFEELLKGDWVVNKNPQVPFCALGADHALEQVNHSMKVSGGLVGITLNPHMPVPNFSSLPRSLPICLKMPKKCLGPPRRKKVTIIAPYQRQ